jgi:hypothetical protein
VSSLKPMAMLSSELLARKGSAVPAVLALQLNPMAHFPALPMASPRLELRAPPSREPQAAWRVSSGDKSGSVKVSLRLDVDRHRRLRRAVLQQGSSGQKVLLAALDAYLDALGTPVMDDTIACLRSQPS